MPGLTTRTPKYRRHPNGGAVVSIDSSTHYSLAATARSSSRQAYDRLIAGGRMLPSHHGPTVNELVPAFDKRAEAHYQKHGEPTRSFLETFAGPASRCCRIAGQPPVSKAARAVALSKTALSRFRALLPLH